LDLLVANFILLDFCSFLGAEKERRTLDSIANARQKISHEITELNERLKASKEAIQHFQKEIQKVEKEQDALTPSTSTVSAT
jgi:septal ring factor EnvC (AmiA/AmiB activator)